MGRHSWEEVEPDPGRRGCHRRWDGREWRPCLVHVCVCGLERTAFAYWDEGYKMPYVFEGSVSGSHGGVYYRLLDGTVTESDRECPLEVVRSVLES